MKHIILLTTSTVWLAILVTPPLSLIVTDNPSPSPD
jgi:hypothetical protein